MHCAGHCGDGNVHIDILKDDRTQGRMGRKCLKIQGEIYALVYKLAAVSPGEHGIGYKREALLENTPTWLNSR